MRKSTVIGVLIATTALLATACTVGGPAPNTWKVKPVSIKVVDDEDNDGGDEPYAIQLGFRAKVGVLHSSNVSVSSQCPTQINSIDPFNPNAGSINNGETKLLGNAADITFPLVQNLDIGDVILGTAPLEIFGTLSFVMERDAIFQSCEITNLIRDIGPILDGLLEELISQSPVPPTQEDLVQLLVDNIGNILHAAVTLVAALFEGLGNPDDIMGIAVQIHLPTAGAFADLVNAGLGLAGVFSNGVIDGQGNIAIPDQPAVLKVKLGNLLPSSQTFDFDTEGGRFILKTSIAAG